MTSARKTSRKEKAFNQYMIKMESEITEKRRRRRQRRSSRANIARNDDALASALVSCIFNQPSFHVSSPPLIYLLNLKLLTLLPLFDFCRVTFLSVRLFRQHQKCLCTIFPTMKSWEASRRTKNLVPVTPAKRLKRSVVVRRICVLAWLCVPV